MPAVLEASVTAPAAISAIPNTVSTGCGLAQGSATVTPSGGTAPFTYLWSPGNQTTSSATNLTAGSYTVTVNDDNGCFKLASARVIAKCCDNGFDILKDRAKQQPDPYQEIYLHLKNELQ